MYAARTKYQVISQQKPNLIINPKKQNKTKQNKPIKQQNRKVNKTNKKTNKQRQNKNQISQI